MYVFVIVALTTSTGVFSPFYSSIGLLMGKAPRRSSVEDSPALFVWGSEETDTCAMEIMVSFPLILHCRRSTIARKSRVLIRRIT